MATHDVVRSRLDEVVDIKGSVESRRRQLDTALGRVLSGADMATYRDFVESVGRHRVDLLWIEDRIEMSKRQLNAVLSATIDRAQFKMAADIEQT